MGCTLEKQQHHVAPLPARNCGEGPQPAGHRRAGGAADREDPVGEEQQQRERGERLVRAGDDPGQPPQNPPNQPAVAAAHNANRLLPNQPGGGPVPLPPIRLDGYWCAGTVEPGAAPAYAPSEGPYSLLERVPADTARQGSMVFGTLRLPVALSLHSEDAEAPLLDSAVVAPCATAAPVAGKGGNLQRSPPFEIPRILKPATSHSSHHAYSAALPLNQGKPLSQNPIDIGVAQCVVKIVAHTSEKEPIRGSPVKADAPNPLAAPSGRRSVEENSDDEAHPTDLQVTSEWLVGRAFLKRCPCNNSVGWVKVRIPEIVNEEDGTTVELHEYCVTRDGSIEYVEKPDSADDPASTQPSSPISLLRRHLLYPVGVTDLVLFLRLNGRQVTSNVRVPLKSENNSREPVRRTAGAVEGAFLTIEVPPTASAQYMTSQSLLIFPPLDRLRPINHGGSELENAESQSIQSGGVPRPCTTGDYSNADKWIWLNFREQLNVSLLDELETATADSVFFEDWKPTLTKDDKRSSIDEATGSGKGKAVPLQAVPQRSCRLRFSIDLGLQWRYPNQVLRMVPASASTRTGGGSSSLESRSYPSSLAKVDSRLAEELNLCRRLLQTEEVGGSPLEDDANLTNAEDRSRNCCGRQLEATSSCPEGPLDHSSTNTVLFHDSSRPLTASTSTLSEGNFSIVFECESRLQLIAYLTTELSLVRSWLTMF
jgi:hypothetical protein